MNARDMKDLVEILYPFIKEKIKNEYFLSDCVRRKNATVVEIPDANSNMGKMIKVSFPYDENLLYVRNESGENLSLNDLVCIEYSHGIKNSVITYKIKK